MKSPQETTILIVDDTPENLRVLIAFLEEMGFRIAVAQNGETALQRVQQALPDIILLDVIMPGIDGFEICRRLKEHEATRNVPVIFMTVVSDTIEKLKGFEVGGVDYVTKPFQKEEVLARVKAHLTIRDQQQQLQQQNSVIQKQNEELRVLNATKDTFFSILAHDLRDPFTTLFGYTELLEKDLEHYTKAEIKTSVAKLRKGVTKIYTLLENLLEWSRLQRGQIKCLPKEYRVAVFVDEMTYMFHTRVEQKQLMLLSHVQSPEMTVYADYEMVSTVLRNLTSNAIKFTEVGGTIMIHAKAVQNGDYVEFAVSDTGIGMDAETLARLFRIEVKTSHAGTSGEKGTGLGLILCKELVEKNGGRIWAENTSEKGSKFLFTLPAKSSSSTPTI